MERRKTDVQELMAKVGKIRILTNKLIDDQLSGDYHSTFKGQGVEFDEVRPYAVGDDVRTIDWNVTARTGAPYIKRYSEERELTVLFMVDVSGSQSYGSRGRTKAELAAEVTALLALTAIRNQDKVGLVLFSDRIVKYIPPRKGRDSVMRLAREVLAAGEDAEGGTDILAALRFLNQVQKRRAVVFLVSDFLQQGGDDAFARLPRAPGRGARRAGGSRDGRARARRHVQREAAARVCGGGGRGGGDGAAVLRQDGHRHAAPGDRPPVHRRRARAFQAPRPQAVTTGAGRGRLGYGTEQDDRQRRARIECPYC